MTASLTPSPYTLAIERLQDPRIQLAPYLPLERVERALASSGAGLDHLAGERPLALGEDSAGQFTNFFLLTDRRLAGRNDAYFGRAHAFQIDHAAITGVDYAPDFRKPDQQSDRLTPPSLRIFAGDTIVDATVPAFIQPLGQYVTALSKIVAEDRSPSIDPLTMPTADDPSGAFAAARLLRAPHPQCSPMLELIAKGVGLRMIPTETGRDLAARAVLLYRTMTFGRGMANGWWMSPLSAADLIYATLQVMGKPTRAFQQGETHCFDFEMSAGGGAGQAAASTAVGLIALGVLGVGWVSAPKSVKRTLRVAVYDAPHHSSFAVSLADGSRLTPLSFVNPEALRGIWNNLAWREAQLMLLRCAFSWGSSPDQLVSIPAQIVTERLRQFDQ